MKPVAWDDRALDDLDAIAKHIAQDSPSAARRVVAYIKNASLALEVSPALGRSVEATNLREFVLTRYPYILVYEDAPDEVQIFAVFHHRQQRR